MTSIGGVVHTWNPSKWEGGAEDSEIQGLLSYTECLRLIWDMLSSVKVCLGPAPLMHNHCVWLSWARDLENESKATSHLFSASPYHRGMNIWYHSTSVEREATAPRSCLHTEDRTEKNLNSKFYIAVDTHGSRSYRESCANSLIIICKRSMSMWVKKH